VCCRNARLCQIVVVASLLTLLVVACSHFSQMSKRRRLSVADLSGLGCVTDAALAKILGTLRDADELAGRGLGGISQRSIARATVSAVQQSTPYGPPMQTMKLPTVAGEFLWHYIHPGAVLNYLASESSVFADTLYEAHAARPSSPESPWGLIWYYDDSTPGNILALDQTRKAAAIYWSLAELGFEALSKECFWMLGGIIRYANCCEVVGGMSCVFASCLKSFFGGEHNLASSGFTINTYRGTIVLFAKLRTTVADEAALKSIWSLKGASGLRPCALCSNAVGNRAEFDLDDDSPLVAISCASFSRFRPQSDEQLWVAAERVASPHLSRAQRADLEKFYGIKHSPQSILLDATLRQHAKPCDVLMYDAAHVLFVHGVVQYEITNFLRAAKAVGVDYNSLHQYLQHWTFPKNIGNHQVKNLFHPRRAADEHFKSGASQALAVYPIIRDFAQRVMPNHVLVGETRSLLALFRVVDAYVSLQCQRMPSNFAVVCEEFMQAHQEVYPASEMKPKHHYLLHLPALLQKHGNLYSCLVHERKHKVFKRFASTTTNLASFEKTVEIDLLNEQVRQLERCRLGSYLCNASFHTGAIKELLQAAEVQVAKVAVHKLVTSTVGDLVWVSGGSGQFKVAEVLLHISCKPPPVGSTGLVSLVRMSAAAGDVYTNGGPQVVIPLEWIVSAATCSRTSAGIRVLRPAFAV
jgi:hypothetical protein